MARKVQLMKFLKRKKYMERTQGMDATYAYTDTEPSNDSPLLSLPLDHGRPPLAQSDSIGTRLLEPRRLPYPTHDQRRRGSVQIPQLANVEISLSAVDQLRGLHAIANRNVEQGTPLDQRQVSLVARGYVAEGNRLMIDDFEVRRHLNDTQRTVVQGSKVGSGVWSLVGAIIGGIMYSHDNAAGAYGTWFGALIALWPMIEAQIIDRLCKAPDVILREQERDPAIPAIPAIDPRYQV